MTKRAILIGIDTYPLLEKRYQLGGCKHAVWQTAELLCTRFGFARETVSVLTDDTADHTTIFYTFPSNRSLQTVSA